MKNLDKRIEESLQDNPEIEDEYIVKNITPWEERDCYIGDDVSGNPKSFHTYSKIKELHGWYNATKYKVKDKYDVMQDTVQHRKEQIQDWEQDGLQFIPWYHRVWVYPVLKGVHIYEYFKNKKH